MGPSWITSILSNSFTSRAYGRFATGIITEIAYGHRIVSIDDPYLHMAEQVSQIILDGGNLGTTLVDIFPICGFAVESTFKVHLTLSD